MMLCVAEMAENAKCQRALPQLIAPVESRHYLLPLLSQSSLSEGAWTIHYQLCIAWIIMDVNKTAPKTSPTSSKFSQSQAETAAPQRSPGRFRICWTAIRESLQRPSLLGSASDHDHDASLDITAEDILHAGSSYFSPGTTVTHSSYPFAAGHESTIASGSAKRGTAPVRPSEGADRTRFARRSITRSRSRRPALPRADTSTDPDELDEGMNGTEKHEPVSHIVVESDLGEWTAGRIEVPIADGASILSKRSKRRDSAPDELQTNGYSQTHSQPGTNRLGVSRAVIQRSRAGRVLSRSRKRSSSTLIRDLQIASAKCLTGKM